MSAIEETAMELKLDRSDWELVRFGDVAIQQKKSVDRENTHLKRYVTGAHMSSEDLHLRDWGNLEDEYLGPAFIRYFEEGDILYGSRRTYLRKVTIAPFEGITANTTFVVKPNEDLIDKRLLPFVMLSEGFSQHSIRNSKGSVNPYVNWKDLANYEFLLPPKEQQAEIAELLWAMDAVMEKNLTLEKALRTNLDSLITNVCFRDDGIARQTMKMEEVVSSISSGTSVICEDRECLPDDIAVLKTSSITGRDFYPSEAKVVKSRDRNKLKASVRANSILLNRKNTRALVGSTKFISQDYDHLFLPDLIWDIRVDTEVVNPEFAWYLLNTVQVRAKMSALSNGTNESMVNISKQNFEKMTIALPNVEVQNALLQKAKLLRSATKDILTKIESSKTLQKSLINQVF